MNKIFKTGSIVRLKGYKKQAKIKIFYRDIEGGVKLDRKLQGYWSWNIDDLEIVSKNEVKI